MKLWHVRIFNYKSFRDTGPVALGTKFTVVVGQNAAGKTAFLESLSPATFSTKPHRVPARGPYGPPPDPMSRAHFSVSVSGAELLHRVISLGPQLWLPVANPDPGRAKGQANDAFSQSEIKFELDFPAGGPWNSSVTPSHQLFQATQQIPSVLVGVTEDRQSWRVLSTGSGADGLPDFIGQYLTNSVYLFRAERLNVGESGIEASSQSIAERE
jgi:hypothetical protein